MALRGPCVQCDAVSDVVSDTYCLWSLTSKVQLLVSEGDAESQCADELLWYNSVECLTEINEQHSQVSPSCRGG